MKTTTVLLSVLSLLLLLSTPPAIAAEPLAAPGVAGASATACQDGAKAAVDGVIHKVISHDDGTYLYIQTDNFDCSPITILAGSPGTCKLGSTIHAEGKLSKPDQKGHVEGWILSDMTTGDDRKLDGAFSCK